MAKYNSFDEIIYVSRNDFQVKIRGQRIETAGVENVIMASSNDITNCLVVKFEHSIIEEDYLIAYITTYNNIDISEIIMKKYCQIYLPQFMIPTQF
ncbi:unnamed protein product, partial [Didymodactylos carnosus]